MAAHSSHEGRGVTPVFQVPPDVPLELRVLAPASAQRSVPLSQARPFGVSILAPHTQLRDGVPVPVMLSSTHRGHVTVGLYKKEKMLTQVGVSLAGEAPIVTTVNLVP